MQRIYVERNGDGATITMNDTNSMNGLHCGYDLSRDVNRLNNVQFL